jgi:hypothetical protein
MHDIRQRNGRTLRHLRRRCQQRGVRAVDLEMLLNSGDQVVGVGGGRIAITLTRAAAAALRAEGVGASLIDRARKRALVVNGSGDTITVVVPSGRRGRHYRRDARHRRRRARR